MKFEDFCKQNNIVINYSPNLSTSIRGLCLKIEYTYVIAINTKFRPESQKKTLKHEIIHIMQNHFQYPPHESYKCEKEVQMLIDNIEI